MRKQSYIIIGVGLAITIGILWLGKLGKKEKTSANLNGQSKNLANHQKDNTLKDSSLEPFVQRQHSAFEDPQYYGEAEEFLGPDPTTIYANSPRGNQRESILDSIADYEKEGNEEWANGYREELAKYDALDPEAKARADLNNWLLRQELKRWMKAGDELFLQLGSREFNEGNPEILVQERRKMIEKFRKNELDNYATEAEVQVEEALSKLSHHYYFRPRHWHVVANYLRGIRADSQRELVEGNPEDSHWHINHIHWIEETAEAMGIPLDNPEDTSWIDAKMAEKERKHHEETKARIMQYNADIDTHPIHEEARQFIPRFAEESKQRNTAIIWEQEARRKANLAKEIQRDEAHRKRWTQREQGVASGN